MSSTPRPKQFNIRVSADEHKLIAKRAKAAGMAPSDYARARLLADDESVVQAASAYMTLSANFDEVEDAVAKARRALGGSKRRK